jgi:tetratricopeptide (TPR) repeat protein
MLLAVDGLVLLTTILAAQVAAAPASSERSLLDLAEEYRTGDREKAVGKFGLWSREEVEQEVERLVLLFRRAPPTATALRPAAVTLLAESALRAREAGAFSLVRWLLLDAARLVAAVPAAKGGSTFERRFYLFAGLALHRSGQAEAAHGVLLKALENAKDDAELHTALGTVIETIASLRTYDHSPDSRPEGRGGYKTEDGERGSLPFVKLADSEAHYEKALAIDPTLVEARLRLGRTRLLRGRPAEALRDLERVAAEASQPGHRYMARLFEGRALEVRGDLDGAAAAYRAAVEEVPMAQSALIALGRALDGLGDSATAQEALEAAAARSKPYDPWLGYRLGQPERLPGLLEDLRGLIP